MKRKNSEIRSRQFTIGTGYNPIESDTYSALQESLTAPSYEIAYEPSRPDPVLHRILVMIGRQEYLHSAVFLKAVQVALKHNPGRINDVVKTIGEFKMPSHEVVPPEIQQKLGGWAKKYHFPVRAVLSRMGNQFIEVLGHKAAGKALRLYAENNNIGKLVKTAMTLAKPIPDALFARAADIYINRLQPKTL